MEYQSAEVNELVAALVRFQLAGITVHKNRTGQAKGNRDYRYADLEAIEEATRGPLAREGLVVVQTTRALGEHTLLVSTLYHTSGQWVRGECAVDWDTRLPQNAGSSFTYFKRYAKCALLGIVAEDDDDAARAQAAGAAAPRGRAPQPRPQPRRDTTDPAPAPATGAGEPRGHVWTPWVQWFYTTTNDQWAAHLERHRVDREERGQLVQHPEEVVNLVCSHAIGLGHVEPRAVQKVNGNRDPGRARVAVAELFRRAPKKVKAYVREHFRGLAEAECARLGIDPGPYAPTPAAAADDPRRN